MKTFVFLLYLTCSGGSIFSQNTSPVYDSAFQELYKQIALHPPTLNSRGKPFQPVIKKWDQDISIFIEGGNAESRNHIEQKLKNVISGITPALGNKIKISFVTNKSGSNYLIKLDTMGQNSTWYLRWDAYYNIYNCILTINTKTVFNLDEQAGKVSSDFLKSLGDFNISQLEKPVASNMVVWRKDMTQTDLRILELQYSDEIKPGMKEKDIDRYFFSHGQ